MRRTDNERIEQYPTMAGHIGALVGILFVSSIACSLPSISKRYKRLRLPSAVFFIGKHFGTGVILSTAFVHLLQDAFKHLSSESVPEKWRGSTGAIVLVSILSIFVVEYLSTAYVERAEYADLSRTATVGEEHGRSQAESFRELERDEEEPLLNDIGNGVADYSGMKGSSHSTHAEAHTHPHPHPHTHEHGSDTGEFFTGHHRYEERGPCASVSNKDDKNTLVRTQTHTHTHERGGRLKKDIKSDDVGGKRQVVGIFVLQIGIMLHSLVIGITLAITTGSEFTSLLLAIIFHQLFEGLSLGVRISILPNTHSSLRVLLCGLFAVTLPVGILVGLGSFGGGEGGATKFVQGLMASISAGLLIYASTVEMLAGDFVMDKEIKLGSLSKQAIALVSLVAGAGVMGVLG